jgi:hypothetical protein
MTGTLRRLVTFIIWTGIIVFSAVGLSGVIFGPWEFELVVPVALDTVEGDRVTLFNQLRFLKALELAVGIMLFALRRDILERASINRAVTALLCVTPMARAFSLLADGMPDASFIALMCVELTGAAVMTAYSVSRFGVGAARALAHPSPVAG